MRNRTFRALISFGTETAGRGTTTGATSCGTTLLGLLRLLAGCPSDPQAEPDTETAQPDTSESEDAFTANIASPEDSIQVGDLAEPEEVAESEDAPVILTRFPGHITTDGQAVSELRRVHGRKAKKVHAVVQA